MYLAKGNVFYCFLRCCGSEHGGEINPHIAELLKKKKKTTQKQLKELFLSSLLCSGLVWELPGQSPACGNKEEAEPGIPHICGHSPCLAHAGWHSCPRSWAKARDLALIFHRKFRIKAASPGSCRECPGHPELSVLLLTFQVNSFPLCY